MTKQAFKFNPNHIFVDTNVLVGGYSGDTRYQNDADCLHYLFALTGKKLYISTLSVSQLISVYQKKKSNLFTKKLPKLKRKKFILYLL